MLKKREYWLYSNLHLLKQNKFFNMVFTAIPQQCYLSTDVMLFIYTMHKEYISFVSNKNC